MSDETFADLFQAKSLSQKSLQPGERITAVVIDIKKDSVFLDIGGKSEGLLDAAELRGEDGELTVQPGDELVAFFLAARGGEMVFTTRLGAGQASSRELAEAWRSGIPVEGKVTAEVKGGFSVTVAGLRGFCPYSQIDVRRVEDAAEYIERTMLFKVIEFGERNNIILSARAVIEEERQRAREELQERLLEGMIVPGVVSSLRDFGAFVDIGGIDGLIPISELAWGQTDRVEDVLSLGQEVQVLVKSLDWARDRIGLSLKETTANPWDTVAERYPVGSIVRGRVSRLAAFGAFVSLEPGIDGLLHISKLGGGRRIHHPREVLEVGQDVTVTIEALDTEKKRLSLAPEDYVPKEQEKGKGKKAKEEDAYVPPPQTPVSMGTLGDLLQSQMAKKKKL